MELIFLKLFCITTAYFHYRLITKSVHVPKICISVQYLNERTFYRWNKLSDHNTDQTQLNFFIECFLSWLEPLVCSDYLKYCFIKVYFGAQQQHLASNVKYALIFHCTWRGLKFSRMIPLNWMSDDTLKVNFLFLHSRGVQNRIL